MADRLPPEFLASLMGGGAPMPPMAPPMPPMDPMMGPMAGPMPPMDPMMGGAPPMDPNMGSMVAFGAAAQGMPLPDMGPLDVGPMPLTQDPSALPAQNADPVLSQMLAAQNGLIQTPMRQKPRRQRFAGLMQPTIGMVQDAINSDLRDHAMLLTRFARDLAIYRQHDHGRPHGFDPLRDIGGRSAGLSNLVNKLTNMMAAIEMSYDAPNKDEATKEASQGIEDFCYQARDLESEYYTLGGGNPLQWDEFFYLFLYGRLVCRVLPDEWDEEFPFAVELLDPATCYPTFDPGGKRGMIRMTRVYQSTVADIIATYGEGDPKLEKRIRNELGHDGESLHTHMNYEMKVHEYWDQEFRAVLAQDMVIVPVVKHQLGQVPFAYVTAKGEPHALFTPEGQYPINVKDEYGNAVFMGRGGDLQEKGVSVFHHLIQTHKLQEVMQTLLITEALKSTNPATITYSAPQLMGKEPKRLDNKAGGTNQRGLNVQKVEAIPTSPRPTDVAPVLNKLDQDIAQGSLPPHVFGNESGSNVSGFAVESLIAAAKDAILPYTRAFENYQSQKIRMMLRYYRDIISPVTLMQVPSEGNHGINYVRDLTPDMVDQVGTKVKVRLYGISAQNLPGQIAAAAQAMQAGIWSQERAMQHVGERNPQRMLADIITEKAIQHPEIMENFIIPQALTNRGDEDLVRVWMTTVVAPKMMQAMGGMMGGAPGGAPPGDPMAAMMAGGGPEPNGQSAPMEGAPPPPPGGPAPGQGRGPAGA